MNKILFLAERSKTAAKIFSLVEKEMPAETKDFLSCDLPALVRETQPPAVIAYINEISDASREAFLQLLEFDEPSEFVLVGSESECFSYAARDGKTLRRIITPITSENFRTQILLLRSELAGKAAKAKKNILLVDDDIVALRTFMEALKDEYRVSVAKSGTDAIAFLGRSLPDLILLDYAMPVLNGPETLRLIRSEERFEKIPVFFLTGVTDSALVKEAVMLKPEGYILKSITSEQLRKRIAEFFEEQ